MDAVMELLAMPLGFGFAVVVSRLCGWSGVLSAREPAPMRVVHVSPFAATLIRQP